MFSLAQGVSGGFRELDQLFPPRVALHVILTDRGAHVHRYVRQWLRRRPRFILHVAPTGRLWLNLVGRCVQEVTQRPTHRRRAFVSASDLKKAIRDFLGSTGRSPHPFGWTVSE